MACVTNAATTSAPRPIDARNAVLKWRRARNLSRSREQRRRGKKLCLQRRTLPARQPAMATAPDALGGVPVKAPSRSIALTAFSSALAVERDIGLSLGTPL